MGSDAAVESHHAALDCISSTHEGLGVEAQREAERRYLVSHHGEQIAELVEVESGKRSDRPQLVAAMALAKKRKATLLVAKLDRLSRRLHRHADGQQGLRSRIADMPGANRLTSMCSPQPPSTNASRSAIEPASACRRQARGIKLGNPKQAEVSRVKAVEQAQALRPLFERCITSSSAIATDLNARGITAPNGGRWFMMQVSRARQRLGLAAAI